MQRISNKMLREFLATMADIKSDKYRSKFDGSYLTQVGMEDQLKFLIRKGITEQIQNHRGIGEHTSNIGFNPKEQKWYGWSHRAIYGFRIGSEIKKGNCAYMPTGKKDFAEDILNFWTHKTHQNISYEIQGKGVNVTWEYSNDIPNEKLRGTFGSVFQDFPEQFGRGEWTAKTLEDAKQMAKDFAEGVS